MTEEQMWNLNILCVDAEEDTLKLYQNVLMNFSRKLGSIVTGRYIKTQTLGGDNGRDNSRIFSALSGKAAVRTALEAKNRGMEIAVGFFDIGVMGDLSGLDAIREVKRIFPSLLCAVVTEVTDEGVAQIREVFDSQDEWLYIKKPFTEEELLQMACNLVVSWNLRSEQEAALHQIRDGKEGVRHVLIVTPKLFGMQTEEELCYRVVEKAAEIMETSHAFLSMHKNGRNEFTTGVGKYVPQSEEDKQEFLTILDDPTRWETGCLVPLSLGGKPLGLLFVDELPAEKRDTEILELFTQQATYAFENLQTQRERVEQKAREKELKIGKNIQQSLLPKSIPFSKDIELYGLMQSATEIGGDYYDFLHREIPPNQVTDDIFISIGDVAGKGVAAGLIMSEARSFIRALTPFYTSPREILEQVARLLEKDIWGTGKFMSLLLLYWDSRQKKFFYTSAGHEHIIHYKARQRKCSVFKAGGMVLGLKSDIVVPQLKESELIIEPDDVIVLFTDGATEAQNVDGDMFSLDRVVGLTAQYSQLSAGEILDNIFQDICNFIGECEAFDDITMVAIKRKKE